MMFPTNIINYNENDLWKIDVLKWTDGHGYIRKIGSCIMLR